MYRLPKQSAFCTALLGIAFVFSWRPMVAANVTNTEVTAQASQSPTPTPEAGKKKSKSKKKEDATATPTPTPAPAAAPATTGTPASKPSPEKGGTKTSKTTAAGAPSQSEIDAAKASGKVWVNLDSGVYHKGGHWYGNTKNGKFMTEAEAQKAGYREAQK